MLVVLTSHPIQYQAPLWRALAEEVGKRREAKGAVQQEKEDGGGVAFEVWFLTDQGVRRTEDKEFGRAFAWDVDLISGYPHRFVTLSGDWNIAKFNGIPLAKPIGESLREAGATALWVEGWRFKPFWDAVVAAKRMGIPVFLRGETSDKIVEKSGLFGLLRNFALHRFFKKIDHFLVIGEASRRFYRRHGVPEGKMIDAPYCVDNAFFRSEAGKIRGVGRTAANREGTDGAHSEIEPFDVFLGEKSVMGVRFDKDNFEHVTEAQREIRREWNIPDDTKVVMFCGKFVSKKRPEDLVKAAVIHDQEQRMNEGQMPWHLLFVGSGGLGDKLRASCDVRFDAEREVGGVQQLPNAGAPPASFVGFLNQSKISKAYAVADVVVLPSEAWETWGLVINEATAAGVPTVVSRDCGCSEDFAERNRFTRTFEMGDAKALAAAIEAALRGKVSWQDVSCQAEWFSPRITAEAVLHAVSGKVEW